MLSDPVPRLFPLLVRDPQWFQLNVEHAQREIVARTSWAKYSDLAKDVCDLTPQVIVDSVRTLKNCRKVGG